jgi:pyruvate/2-oxoglutarate dehydrogenase complex dihydrolipoamide dehydrogenase (E3) component
MTKNIKADLCIIGAGSGGLSLAAGAAQLGRKVVLFEEGEMGGDCLNTGCVPSKALIAAASRAHAMRNAAKYGVASVDPQVDFAAVMDHVHGVIAAIAPIDSQERFEGFGVNVIRAHAEFTGPRTIAGGGVSVDAKHIVIAAGSRPFVPPIKGVDATPYLTNETLFENRVLPKHLIVIGGGPIGVEMAQAHRRLGADVTIVEGAETILGKDDPELVEVVRAQLEKDGVKIIENAMVEEVSGEAGAVSVRAGGQTLEGSHLLIAVGRTPNVDRLNLEAAGIEYDKKGVKVDASLQTSNKRVYAMGDIAGGRQFTHVAGYHASVLVRKILFKTPAKNNEDQAPWVTYSDPELAHVGLTEKDARDRHGDVKVVRWTAEENDRAQAERDTRGLVKAVTDKGGKVLGASIVGAGAGDLIQPWAFAISNGQKIRAFTNYIAPYPTRGEMSKRAAGQWYTPTLFSKRTRALVSLLSVFD